MNSYPLTVFWLKVLALLAVEVGIVALLFAILQRACRTAVWRRTLCQAALITSIAIGLSELSGVGRSAAARIFATAAPGGRGTDKLNKSDKLPGTTDSNKRVAVETVETVNPSSRSEATPLKRGVNENAGNEERLPQTILHIEHLKAVETRSTASQISAEESDAAERVSARYSKSSEAKNHQIVTDTTLLFGLGMSVAIGITFVAGRAFFGRFILIFLGSRRKVATDATISRRVDAISRSLKISRRVRIIESRRLVGPIAFGLLRPTIGLPLNFCERYSAVKQEAMLTHELAHLAAHDPFWYLLADLIAALFWWHPGVWWMRRQLQLSSELAADEASLLSADGPRVLAECLVEIGAQLAKPALGQLRVAGFRSDLGCRVQRLIKLEGAKWTPISRTRTILTRSIGPMTIAGAVILCTAWAVPRQLTQGESMNTMKQNWQRALATFATIAAMQSPNIIVAQQNPPGAAPPPQGLAPGNFTPAQNQPGTTGPIPADPNAGRPGRNEFLRRYGISGETGGGGSVGGAMPYVPGGQPGFQPHGGRLEGKLREIVLDEVRFDGLPLSEVLNFLSDTSLKRDPEKKGINFLINPNSPAYPASGVGTVDPTTGLPVAAAPTEATDMNAITVRFNMPLRHVTMADVLDAIVRVADHPIQYSVEDYAVIFSLRPEANVSAPMAGRAPAPPPLVVRTFHVDTNTFVGGLESAFGIKLDTKGKEDSKKIQAGLKELLAQLNVSMDGNKAIFYNELTATVMVRVATEDLDVIQAAIETLGGQALGNPGYAIGYPALPGRPLATPIRR